MLLLGSLLRPRVPALGSCWKAVLQGRGNGLALESGHRDPCPDTPALASGCTLHASRVYSTAKPPLAALRLASHMESRVWQGGPRSHAERQLTGSVPRRRATPLGMTKRRCWRHPPNSPASRHLVPRCVFLQSF